MPCTALLGARRMAVGSDCVEQRDGSSLAGASVKLVLPSWLLGWPAPGAASCTSCFSPCFAPVALVVLSAWVGRPIACGPFEVGTKAICECVEQVWKSIGEAKNTS